MTAYSILGRPSRGAPTLTAQPATPLSTAKMYAAVVSGEGLQVKQGPKVGAGGELKGLVAEWVVHLEDIGKSEEWVDTCETYAAAHWMSRWAALDDITKSQAIQKYISHRMRQKNNKGKRISPVSVRKELSALNTFLK